MVWRGAGPASANPTETAKAVGKDASSLFSQTAEKVQFDGTTLTLSSVRPSTIMFTVRLGSCPSREYRVHLV